MKISCEIIKDLLPLYHDGVCSKESNAMVEEHLACCESCSAELKSMNEVLALNYTKQNMEEANGMKNLSKKWKKGMLKSLLKGVLIALLAVIILALVLYLFMDIRIV